MSAFIVNGRRYPMPASFTLGELATIKRVSGVDTTRIRELLAAGDPDAAMGVLLVVMRRAEPAITIETIEALELDVIEWVDDTEEADAGPPDESPPSVGGEEATIPGTPGTPSSPAFTA